MANYYKGFVKQATPDCTTLTWRQLERHTGNDIKFSSISEIDATLDTSKFHISMPVNGEETYILNGMPLRLKPEEYFIFNPGQAVRGEGSYKKNVEGICIQLTIDTLAEVAALHTSPIEKTLDDPHRFLWQMQPFATKIYGLKENYLGQHLAKLQPVLLAKDSDILFDWDEIYLELATSVLKTHQQIGLHLNAIVANKYSTKQEIYKRLSLAYNYVLENFEQPVSLTDLERIALFSKYHIVRLYRQIYGITPYQHLLQLRIEKAKILLQKNYSHDDIAEQLSFSDRRAFAKAFRKTEGIAPSKFKK